MMSSKQSRAGLSLRSLFGPDYERYEGVYKINIYLLRLLFALMLIFVGYDSWTAILTHQGQWDHVRAAAVCVWASYAMLSILGLINPLKMLPIVLLEILYKIIWLIIVAYPLWSIGRLAGSPAEEMTYAFLWVWLPLIATPWGYVARNYFSFPKKIGAASPSAPLVGMLNIAAARVLMMRF